jgi:hypothetical protein
VGYYTRHRLHLLDPVTLKPVEDPHADDRAVINQAVVGAAQDKVDPYDASWWDPRSGDVYERQGLKWYDHPETLKAASLRTDLIIRLHGVGEEYGDEWVEYHYRGSATYARRPAWDYPSPDPDKLGPFAPAAPLRAGTDPTRYGSRSPPMIARTARPRRARCVDCTELVPVTTPLRGAQVPHLRHHRRGHRRRRQHLPGAPRHGLVDRDEG